MEVKHHVFCNLIAYLHYRIEIGRRILKDHRYLFASDPSHVIFGVAQLVYIDTFKYFPQRFSLEA